MDEHDVPYFRDTVTKETNRLTALCKSWQDISASSEIPEEIGGDIRTAIGLTEWLMDQRFKQFSGLIDDVEKVDKKFNDLEELKANSWVPKPVQEISVVPKKSQGVCRESCSNSLSFDYCSRFLNFFQLCNCQIPTVDYCLDAICPAKQCGSGDCSCTCETSNCDSINCDSCGSINCDSCGSINCDSC